MAGEKRADGQREGGKERKRKGSSAECSRKSNNRGEDVTAKERRKRE